jgi:very-short-patch-repair endonuclease
MWGLLRRNALGLYFRRRHPIGPYVVDFYCSSTQLIIELDGPYLHSGPLAVERDETRSQWLRECGFRVNRFDNDEVLKEAPRVLEAILKAAIARRTLSGSGAAPLPLSLPLEGGGGAQ